MNKAEWVAGIVEKALTETAPEGALIAVNLTPSSWRVVLEGLRRTPPEVEEKSIQRYNGDGTLDEVFAEKPFKKPRWV